MQISKAMQICHEKGIIIKPKGTFITDFIYHFYVLVNDKPVPFKDPKKITVKPKQKQGFKELNEALEKTYIYYANKIINNEK